MKQAGEVMVHSYPKMPVLEELLNTFAVQRGCESEKSLAARAAKDNMQAEWMTFWKYTEYVNPDYAARYDYVPLRETSMKPADHQFERAVATRGPATQAGSSSNSARNGLILY